VNRSSLASDDEVFNGFKSKVYTNQDGVCMKYYDVLRLVIAFTRSVCFDKIIDLGKAIIRSLK
jgi:hypothetical protein